MCILTGRELEFLESLRTRWRTLYWREFARILSENTFPARFGVGARSLTGDPCDLQDRPMASSKPH